ncbi:TPR domain-containing protein, partial [Stipitochalara longipes BDJ]
MYEIKSAGLKGLGVFAKAFIPRGTRILSESPLLAIRTGQNAGDIYSASRILSLEEKSRFLQLSSHVTKELSILRWSQAAWYTLKYTLTSLFGRKGKVLIAWQNPKEHVMILSIFRNNAFNLGSSSEYQQAVFPRISRINHSCVPNAQGNFHNELGRFNIHATRDIEVGEELTLNYLQELGAGRKKRQERLLVGYGFECECPACDLKLETARDGERRRIRMHEHLAEYVEDMGSGAVQSLEADLEAVQRFIRLLEGEGIAGRELSTLYLEAAKLNQGYAKCEEALRCAERGLALDEDCLGTDHPLYQNSLKAVNSLKKN